MVIKRIKLANGKYTIILHDTGQIEALRYGLVWQSLTDNPLFKALIEHVATQDEIIQRVKNWPDGGNTAGQAHIQRYINQALKESQ